MERLLVEFARHADRERFSLRFVGLGGRGPVADEIESLGWPVATLDARPGVWPSIVYRLVREFAASATSIVHTHNTKPLLYAGPAARLAGVEGTIHTMHGRRIARTARQGRLFRFASRFADRLVAVSDDVRCVGRGTGLADSKTCTIHNGVDSERFRLVGPRAGGPAVFVGRLSPEKDLATLLRAVAIVAREVPSYRLVIAGSGPSERETRELARAIGIGGNVEFLGAVRDVPEVLARASVFVLSSITEGLPLAALEAMCCGLPVVATIVGGVPEAVADGVSGLLVPPAQPALLAEGLLAIARDPERSRAMGLAGHEQVVQRFDVRSMVSRYEALYKEALDHRARVLAKRRAG
jgi:glycosyltransferase involved in cell wall biosynthesis